jgi:SHS2 domain-containing protein
MDSSAKVGDTAADRLPPRTSGRRFERKEERKRLLLELETTTELDESEFRRQPRQDVQSRIDAAICARKEQRNVFLSDQDLPGETEILGDYEYLDHTADIQLHSWGDSFEQAVKLQVLAMFGYTTKLSLVEIDEEASKLHASDILAEGHDIHSLVFAFLQEWLTVFHETGFVVRELTDFRLDRQLWQIQCSGRGEVYNPAKHTQGTEVKAITYSNLTINETEERCDIFVIVDI